MNREQEGLKQLGRKTEYKSDYAPEVLETFENRHPENDYWVQFNCPEFTSLCPITGQPDFAEIKIMYIPDHRMVESKSLKLYLFSFRNHGDFHEDVAASASIPTPTTAAPARNTSSWPSSAFCNGRWCELAIRCFYIAVKIRHFRVSFEEMLVSS